MVRFCVYARALVCLCALFSPMTFAKSVSLKTLYVEVPSNYGLLKTEIHFDERDLEVAVKVKKIVTDDLIRVINYFQSVPRNVVHINVDPYTRLTNGNARTFPTNIINLYNFPPNNSDHLIILEDWLRGLVFHEYTHITHLDQTRGYLKFFRHIFGSVATLPTGIVPRWFTEGIAVWSESHLIGGGRLNNPLFRKELLIQFMRAEYCENISCLDEPGVYPGGQLAYWAGAHFIEYLENKKPGTVKCLVEENSDNIPFNLNNVFQNCAGSKAQDLFAEFRTHLIKNQPAVTPESEAWGDKISNAFGSDDLQKGIVLDGNTLFKVEIDRKREALVSYDLQENVNMMISQFRFPIADVVGITTVPNVDNEQSDQGKFLIVGFNEDLRFRGDNHTWKLINTETLLIEHVLPFHNDPSYIIGLGNNRYLTASFIQDKWIIERQKVDLAKNTLVESEVLYDFGKDINLTYFKKQGSKVFMKLNRGEAGTTLYVSELTLENFYKLYESKEYFDLPILHDSFLVLREKEVTKLVELNSGFKNASISILDKTLLNKVTSVEMTDSRVLVLETRLKTKEMPLKESFSYLKKNIGRPTTVKLSAEKFQVKTSPNTLENQRVESFPKFSHLLPHYWFLTTGTGENTTSIGATTTFSDPMDLNYIDLSVVAYTEEKKAGGNLDFYHKFSSISDLWMVTGFFNHEYSKTDFSEYLNRTTEGNIGTRYSLLMKRWTFFPGIYVGKTEIEDFISNRTVENYGFSGTLNYTAFSFDDYFQGLTFQVKLQNDRPEGSKSYLNTQMLLHTEGRFQERLSAGLKTSYGKLDKVGFRDGVIYGGGVNNAFNNRWHEFYGLPYSNAYGNEIFTFRGYIDWNFWYIYKGAGFFPLYLKEAHLILGREMMSADRIILDDRVYRDQKIHSFFIGPRLKMNVAYFIPVDVDVIFSSIRKPNNGGNVNQVEITVNADLF